jgi:4-hydroxyphenylpyruvate dioxygenase
MALITNKWTGQEYFKIYDFNHIELYVGNAKQSLYYYCLVMGFMPFAYRGPETGSKDYVSYVVKKNQIYVVLTTPININHPANDWLKKHGDGVCDIAFSVENASDAYKSCISRGAESAYEPIEYKDDNYSHAGVKTYGDVIHSFITKKSYDGIWAPGFIKLELPILNVNDTGIIRIDHIVGNVEENKMNYWRDYYENIFGFTNFVVFDDTDISTKFSSLKSRVMRSKNWKVRLPINEPAQGLKKSQIQEYLDFNKGPGVQHIALLSDDICSTIENLRKNGMEFLNVPNTYYDELHSRVGNIDEMIDAIKDLNILVDRDDDGYLLQLFSKPVQDRPTLFYEFIQRKGSRGFGQGNFQALFEAIEDEQERRGNL